MHNQTAETKETVIQHLRARSNCKLKKETAVQPVKAWSKAS